LRPYNKEIAYDFLSKYKIDLDKQIIGISPSAVIGNIKSKKINNSCGKNHIDLCKKIINFVDKKENQIILFPHSPYDKKNIQKCDIAYSKILYNEIKDRKRVFFIEDIPPDYRTARAIIGLFDFYFTGRYHSACSSIYMEVPTICLSWHIKYHDLMSLFFDDFLTLDCRNISISDSMNLIKNYYNDIKWFDKKRINKGKKIVEKKIDDSIKILVKEIKNSNNC